MTRDPSVKHLRQFYTWGGTTAVDRLAVPMQALIDRGEAPGVHTVESAQLRDALNRIKQLEEELRATRLASAILHDTMISL